MDFLKNNRRFSFLLGDKKLEDCNYTVKTSENSDTIIHEYLFDNGLKVTNIAKKYDNFGAYEWVNWFENTSDNPTEIISELWDCDIILPFEHEDEPKAMAFIPDVKSATRIFAPTGSTWATDEFYCDADRRVNGCLTNHICPGNTKKYSPSTGRSSEELAPFFNVSKNNSGIIFAIGWTGQWKCEISRGEDDVTIRTKIGDTAFRLLGGEKFRTSSIVIMPYTGNINASQNKWRHLVKDNFSLIGNSDRDKYGPFCAGIWGGMRSASIQKRLDVITENNIPFENIWIDAGWYGKDTEPTPDEFEGDWSMHTGDWIVSKKIHPNGLVDIADFIHNNNMKFILCFEPERVIATTPIVKNHPEYFLKLEKYSDSLLLNLGDENAWNYCFKTLSDMIEKLRVDCYRQDFNFDPLIYWQYNDAIDRKGISEIKHINGLYRLWDALLEKFPHLMIDNCASGGRRIDIETLRRSVPLWRSDYMCPANFDALTAQCHGQSFSAWMPYSGTGTGRLYDIYHVRSCYSPALTTNYAFSERDNFGDDKDKIDFIKKIAKEFKAVRPYLSENFYPLTEFSDKTDTWCASQYDRPSQNGGLIQIFRRENSPYKTAIFNLNNIDKNAVYSFTDIDGGTFTLSGEVLCEKGFEIEIDTPRTAKIFLYETQ